ncbi:unnamed protein product [Ambrosiozyma monospora]|uniref:Unnamed protein product n=1 Tax=Ambrosiozyma monospora TaxID=43982 RepID=A0ACB5T1G9_AMBMO|nr:unnamed protein product [Ambrosiozyma monospora]
MNKEQLKEVQNYLKMRGYKLKMKKADDAAILISDELEEVKIDQKDALKYHMEPCLKQHINEVRLKLKTGEAQLEAEEKLMREMVEKHSLRDVFYTNDLKSYNTIYTNVTSHGEFNRRLDRIYITPRLFQSKLSFKHLSKFPFTTHHLIQLTLWTANVEAGKPLYKIRPNISNNSNHVNFVTAFDLPNYSDVNLKLDVFCTKTLQRAKALSHYLNIFGAKNSFHAQLITSIKKIGTDRICRSTPEIVSEFTSYNCSLFTSRQQQQQQQSWESSPSLDATQKDTLARGITIREIQKALKQQLASNTESAPGKDGISYRFIDKAFSTTGPLLVEVFNNLFSATELPETMKPVLFRFILKEGKDKDDVTSYKPIALMSTITRLFFKVMVNRLQPIFQNIISKDQQGFIHCRGSHFNIQRLQQLVDKMNQHPDKFQNSFILQLDFQKAFDRVSHQFLKQQLQSISIPEKVINAIMLIVTQQQGQVSVNNFLGMPFPITQVYSKELIQMTN